MDEKCKSLRKTLYNAARWTVAEYWRNDPDRVREVRDQVVSEMYGCSYEDLNEAELTAVINELQVRSGAKNEDHMPEARATFQQLKLVRFYALICAIEYADLSGIVHVEAQSREEHAGFQLQRFIKNTFESKKGMLPSNIYRWLFIRWINPKTHKFLEQGGFRKFTKTPERFFYEYLTPREAQYLITRYREIAANLNTKVTQEDFVAIVTRN